MFAPDPIFTIEPPTEIADVIVMMVSDEDWIHILKGHARADELDNRAAPAVEEEALLPHLHCQGGAKARRIGPGPPRSEQSDLHSSSSRGKAWPLFSRTKKG